MGEHYWIALEDGVRFVGVFTSSESAGREIAQKAVRMEVTRKEADLVRLLVSPDGSTVRMIELVRVPLGEFMWWRLQAERGERGG